MPGLKWCPSCRELVDTTETSISSTMAFMKCVKCGKTLGQVSADLVIWFRR